MRTKTLDPLSDLLRRFGWMCETTDANGWLAARAVSAPELRAVFATQAPKRAPELEALLARPIPPAVPAEPPPPDANLQKLLGQHRLTRDTIAREVMAGIFELLRDVQSGQAAKPAKPAKRK